MSRTSESPTDEASTVYREYVLDVRIVECEDAEGNGPAYRFEAPQHDTVSFHDPERATLYADIYFDVNGFQEAGTGERGIPPEIIQAGRDTVAAYLLTLPGTDRNWVASFYGKKPPEIEQYVAAVRTRADEIRNRAAERGADAVRPAQ